ncbi:MAG: copper amine oxidase N-terminal domain-containing protein, partial [Clostridia bacterium]|nr:copper amine oxidase N-terminal domain-containing protein [Clostridia bacterium]
EERREKRTDAKAFMKELKEDFGKADNEAKKAILSEIAALKKELKDYSIGIFVRGADVDFEKYDGVEPEIENERTLIPLRAVVEALEAEVLWDEKERKITITNNETEVVLVIGKKEAYINGEEVLLEAAPKLRKDRTLVPLRFLAEAFGNEVLWDEESKTVIIE